ncbi:hypothetical protein [Streptomyces sp. NBC_00343]|uniref:hypothetical protein n=1 Tax=Streptomyces sp. NBC_00343 TaxID=2975719 RepID=UPI002E2829E9|nr:hypothetical protein [Streptomyces sp. NBC_00343]
MFTSVQAARLGGDQRQPDAQCTDALAGQCLVDRVGAVQSATGSYTVPVLALTVLTVVAVVLAALLPKFPPQWKIESSPDLATESA